LLTGWSGLGLGKLTGKLTGKDAGTAFQGAPRRVPGRRWRWRHLRDDFAVAHGEGAVGDGGGFGVVGDHEDGLVELAAGLAEHGEDGIGVFRIEVAGGLVGEDDGRVGDEGAGDGDALLLAAGELVGAVVEAAGEAEEAGKAVEEGVIEGLSGLGDVVGDLDVAHGGEGGEEVEALEDEADAGAAEPGAIGVGEAGELDAADGDGAGGGGGEAAEDVEEGGFAGAGRADDGDELAGLDGEVDVAESGDLELAGAVGFAEVARDDDGLCEGGGGGG